MTLSTINKGWAVAQIIALTLTVGGAAFPTMVSADQSNFNNNDNSGHDQNYGDDSHGHDHDSDNDDHDDSHDGDHNGSDNGGHDGNHDHGGHDGDHGDGNNGGGDNGHGGGYTPPPTTANVITTNIVCDNQADLPNWGDGSGPSITSTTAIDYISAHSDCHLTSNWNFQWAPDGTTNPGDNSGAAGSPWTTFGPTAADGTASATIPSTDDGVLTWVREVWQDGYVPFTFGVDQTNGDIPSAGLYCNTDHTNFDNYDDITGAQAGNTYYCVAFNALATTSTTTDNGGGTSTTTDSGTTTTTDSGNSGSSGGGGGGGGSSFGGGNWGGGCGAGFVWSSSALKCVPTGTTGVQAQGQVLGASCGIYMNKNIKLGSSKNDPDQVTKLQTFLNKWMGTNLSLTGIYDSATFAAVEAFQNKYVNQVLKPWGENTPATGLVYLSTVWQINNMECPSLTLPYPTLVPWNQNPNAQ